MVFRNGLILLPIFLLSKSISEKDEATCLIAFFPQKQGVKELIQNSELFSCVAVRQAFKAIKKPSKTILSNLNIDK